MSKKKEPVKAFAAVMKIEATIDIAEGKKKVFNLEVKPLGGAKLTKYNKELEKSLQSDKTSKEDKKAIAKARKELRRFESRYDDINDSIYLLKESDVEGSHSAKILELIAKKEDLEPKLWKAEDVLEDLTEDIQELSLGETIAKSDKEMKKLFDMIVIDDGGLVAFMENEELGYMAMTQYIKEKMEEERGND